MALYLCPDCNQHIRTKSVCPNCHPRSTSSGLPLALLLGIGCHKSEPAKPEVMALYGGPPVEMIEKLEQDADDQNSESNSSDHPDSENVDTKETDKEDTDASETESKEGDNETNATDGTTSDSDKNVDEPEPVKPVVKPLYGLPARPDPTIKKP